MRYCHAWMFFICIPVLWRRIIAIRTSSRSFRIASVPVLTNTQEAATAAAFDERGTKQGYREMVISGEDAITRLIDKANFIIPPTTNVKEFVRWCREIAKRKLSTDQEFRERVKVRELRKQFKLEIRNLEQKLRHAKVAFEEDENSLILYELDRLVINGKQATANMEKLLRGGRDGGGLGATITDGQDTDDIVKEATDEEEMGVKEVEDVSNLLVLDGVTERDNKLAAKIAHVAVIYPQKRLELETNMAERTRLQAVTPTYHAYQNAIKDLEFLFDQIGKSKSLHASNLTLN